MFQICSLSSIQQKPNEYSHIKFVRIKMVRLQHTVQKEKHYYLELDAISANPLVDTNHEWP